MCVNICDSEQSIHDHNGIHVSVHISEEKKMTFIANLGSQVPYMCALITTLNYQFSKNKYKPCDFVYRPIVRAKTKICRKLE